VPRDVTSNIKPLANVFTAALSTFLPTTPNAPASNLGMFVPPRRSDDHAPFDLWIGDGDFRSMTKEEIAWVRTTTGCNGILQGSPFITLEGASIRHYRTIGGQPVCYDNDCSPVRRGAIGNTRCHDPLPELRDVDFFSEAGIAKIVSALPAKPKLVVEFWKTIGWLRQRLFFFRRFWI
jgi:hypothetical protein